MADSAVDPLDNFICTDELTLTVDMIDDFLVIRPINVNQVRKLGNSFQALGYMASAGKITIVHTSGDIGGDNARYGIINGHHRVSALRREQAAGRLKDFRVSASARASRRAGCGSPSVLSPGSVHQLWDRLQRGDLPERRVAEGSSLPPHQARRG